MRIEISRNQISLDLVSEDKKEYYGFVVLGPYKDGHLLHKLFVMVEHRGKGVGNRLIREAAEIGKGALYIVPGSFANSPLTDEQLRDWYLRLGFVFVPGHANFLRLSGLSALRSVEPQAN